MQIRVPTCNQGDAFGMGAVGSKPPAERAQADEYAAWQAEVAAREKALAEKRRRQAPELEYQQR